MLNNKSYNALKWLVMIALPAIAVFINAVGQELGVTNPETLVTLINATTVLLGSLIGVSTIGYNNHKDDK